MRLKDRDFKGAEKKIENDFYEAVYKIITSGAGECVYFCAYVYEYV